MCECIACAARPPIELDACGARPLGAAAPPTRRAVLGGAMAAIASSAAAAQSVPSLISPGDDPLQRDPLWVEGVRSNGRVRFRGRRRVPIPPIASSGPLTLQWPDGLSQRRLTLRN